MLLVRTLHPHCRLNTPGWFSLTVDGCWPRLANQTALGLASLHLRRQTHGDADAQTSTQSLHTTCCTLRPYPETALLHSCSIVVHLTCSPAGTTSHAEGAAGDGTTNGPRRSIHDIDSMHLQTMHLPRSSSVTRFRPSFSPGRADESYHRMIRSLLDLVFCVSAATAIKCSPSPGLLTGRNPPYGARVPALPLVSCVEAECSQRRWHRTFCLFLPAVFCLSLCPDSASHCLPLSPTVSHCLTLPHCLSSFQSLLARQIRPVPFHPAPYSVSWPSGYPSG